MGMIFLSCSQLQLKKDSDIAKASHLLKSVRSWMGLQDDVTNLGCCFRKCLWLIIVVTFGAMLPRQCHKSVSCLMSIISWWGRKAILHFIERRLTLLWRYLAVVLNGTRNPYRSQVAQDIQDAILKKSAGKDGSAEYWSQEEQSKRLSRAYEKWDATGKVWSASAAKVRTDLDVILSMLSCQ